MVETVTYEGQQYVVESRYPTGRRSIQALIQKGQSSEGEFVKRRITLDPAGRKEQVREFAFFTFNTGKGTGTRTVETKRETFAGGAPSRRILREFTSEGKVKEQKFFNFESGKVRTEKTPISEQKQAGRESKFNLAQQRYRQFQQDRQIKTYERNLRAYTKGKAQATYQEMISLKKQRTQEKRAKALGKKLGLDFKFGREDITVTQTPKPISPSIVGFEAGRVKQSGAVDLRPITPAQFEEQRQKDIERRLKIINTSELTRVPTTEEKIKAATPETTTENKFLKPIQEGIGGIVASSRVKAQEARQKATTEGISSVEKFNARINEVVQGGVAGGLDLIRTPGQSARSPEVIVSAVTYGGTLITTKNPGLAAKASTTALAITITGKNLIQRDILKQETDIQRLQSAFLTAPYQTSGEIVGQAVVYSAAATGITKLIGATPKIKIPKSPKFKPPKPPKVSITTKPPITTVSNIVKLGKFRNYKQTLKIPKAPKPPKVTKYKPPKFIRKEVFPVKGLKKMFIKGDPVSRGVEGARVLSGRPVRPGTSPGTKIIGKRQRIRVLTDKDIYKTPSPKPTRITPEQKALIRAQRAIKLRRTGKTPKADRPQVKEKFNPFKDSDKFRGPYQVKKADTGEIFKFTSRQKWKRALKAQLESEAQIRYDAAQAARFRQATLLRRAATRSSKPLDRLLPRGDAKFEIIPSGYDFKIDRAVKVKIAKALRDKFFKEGKTTGTLDTSKSISKALNKRSSIPKQPKPRPTSTQKVIEKDLGGGLLVKQILKEPDLKVKPPSGKGKVKPPGSKTSSASAGLFRSTPKLVSALGSFARAGIVPVVSLKVNQANLAKIDTSLISGTKAAQVQKPIQIPKPAQAQRSTQKPKLDIVSKSLLGIGTAAAVTTGGLTFTGITTSTNQITQLLTTRTRPIIVGPRGGGGSYFKAAKPKRKPKRSFKFTPSLVAVSEGITAKQIPSLITGLGVRPIISRRK